ncbi:hypothetical protein F5B21DRAFT_521425 [Xylaria acuta]|nr:hypothetical protein F5B21DRAFT_521425 [Xylaria acuta]
MERRLENSCIARPPQVSWRTLLAPAVYDDGRSASLNKSECSFGTGAKIYARDMLYEKWQLVTENIEGQLTVASDKLPALSAFAHAFALALGRGQYLSGLWRGNLIWHLLWMVYHDAVKSKSRAPSWSWAAWKGTIEHSRKFDKALLQPQCVVKEAHAPAVGRNPFGTVDAATSWTILTRCKLVKAELHPTSREFDDLVLHPAELCIRKGNRSIVVGHGMIDGIPTSGLKKNGTFKPEDLGSLPHNGDVLALLLVGNIPHVEHEPGDSAGFKESETAVYSQGLLVTPCASMADLQGLRAFERIGMFRSDIRDAIGLWDSCLEYVLKLT